jgi:hypothetical protein
MTSYRIRWANVSHCCGRAASKVRMCIAERRTRFLRFTFWWPVGDWKWVEQAAQRDIERDMALRLPLPAPKEFQL